MPFQWASECSKAQWQQPQQTRKQPAAGWSSRWEAKGGSPGRFLPRCSSAVVPAAREGCSIAIITADLCAGSVPEALECSRGMPQQKGGGQEHSWSSPTSSPEHPQPTPAGPKPLQAVARVSKGGQRICIVLALHLQPLFELGLANRKCRSPASEPKQAKSATLFALTKITV